MTAQSAGNSKIDAMRQPITPSIVVMGAMVITMLAGCNQVKQTSEPKKEFNSLGNWTAGSPLEWNAALAHAPFSGIVLDAKVVDFSQGQPGDSIKGAAYIQVKREDGTRCLIYVMHATENQSQVTSRMIVGRAYWFPLALKNPDSAVK